MAPDTRAGPAVPGGLCQGPGRSRAEPSWTRALSPVSLGSPSWRDQGLGGGGVAGSLSLGSVLLFLVTALPQQGLQVEGGDDLAQLPGQA